MDKRNFRQCADTAYRHTGHELAVNPSDWLKVGTWANGTYFNALDFTVEANIENYRRELGVANATHALKDGDLVEVDAEAGVVRILKRA